MAIIVIKERCPQKHSCRSVRVCPVGALKQEGFHAPTVDTDSCISCNKCICYCRKGALQQT